MPKKKPATSEEILKATKKAADDSICITLQYTAEMPTKKFSVTPRLWFEQGWLGEILLVNHALLIGAGEQNKLAVLKVRFSRKQLNKLIKQAQAILKTKTQYTKSVINKKMGTIQGLGEGSTWSCVMRTPKIKQGKPQYTKTAIKTK